MYVRQKRQKYTYVRQKCACSAFMTRQVCLGTCSHVPGFSGPLVPPQPGISDHNLVALTVNYFYRQKSNSQQDRNSDDDPTTRSQLLDEPTIRISES